ncbi:MAG: M48 family metalloprotease, partial [Myxococcales bacterium]|nr:M48 family metalloprotease [Myxococcales bacterium]
GAPEPAFTYGLFRPTLVLDACFVREIDDPSLRAVLLHELAHIAGRDMFRRFMFRLCRAINPAGALLDADFAHWCSAREAACDSEAVERGGSPLALAHSILRAARFRCATPLLGIAALCGHEMASLRLRLALLLEGPARPRKSFGHAVLLVVCAIALAIPHLHPFAVLDAFHLSVEQLLHPAR